MRGSPNRGRIFPEPVISIGHARILRLLRQMRRPVVRFGIDFAEHSHVGPAIIAVLEAIKASGSLSQAARDLKISYRYAWLLVDGLKSAFREPITVAMRGGKNGGGVSLTNLGESLVLSYRALELEFAEIAARRFQGITPTTNEIQNGRARPRGIARQG